MFRKIKAFLSTVIHTTGRLFYVSGDFGPFHSSLWVGRENSDTVRFAVSVDLDYGPSFGPSLDVGVEAGVIKVEFYLSRSTPE